MNFYNLYGLKKSSLKQMDHYKDQKLQKRKT